MVHHQMRPIALKRMTCKLLKTCSASLTHLTSLTLEPQFMNVMITNSVTSTSSFIPSTLTLLPNQSKIMGEQLRCALRSSFHSQCTKLTYNIHYIPLHSCIAGRVTSETQPGNLVHGCPLNFYEMFAPYLTNSSVQV